MQKNAVRMNYRKINANSQFWRILHYFIARLHGPTINRITVHAYLKGLNYPSFSKKLSCYLRQL